MLRILDLGCGTGDSWRNLGLDVDNCEMIGVDPQFKRVDTATRHYRDRGWLYLCGRGEQLPFANHSFDGAICRGALPYMLIQRALNEVHRVLVPRGWVRMTLHHPTFTLGEFRRCFPRYRSMVGRSFVLVKGFIFHFTGKVVPIRGNVESCQTEAGMRKALRRAGFHEVSFRHEGGRFVVEARREGVAKTQAVCA